MDEYKKSLQQRLQDHEQELKTEKSKQAGASSKNLCFFSLSVVFTVASANSLAQHIIES